MDPAVEHSFLRFSRGCVSPPLSAPASPPPSRGQCTPVFASFASTKIRTTDLPDYHLSFFLPPPPPPPPRRLFLFPTTSLSFSSPHHASSLSLSPFSLVEGKEPTSLLLTVQPTLAHNETENLLLAPGECGRMITYIEQAPLPSSLSLSAPATDETNDSSSWLSTKNGGEGAIDRRNRRRVDARPPLFRSREVFRRYANEEGFESFLKKICPWNFSTERFFYGPNAFFSKEIFVRSFRARCLFEFLFFSNYSWGRFQLIRFPRVSLK